LELKNQVFLASKDNSILPYKERNPFSSPVSDGGRKHQTWKKKLAASPFLAVVSHVYLGINNYDVL